jgi:peptide chain release factor subunit 1
VGDVISEERIRSLAGYQGHPIVTSCYLDVDGRRFPRHVDYENQLEHLVRQGKERATGFGAPAARSIEADLDRITSWVRGGFERSRVRGLAFFACSAEGFFEVVESPRPVRSEVLLNQTPHVRQLQALLDEYERFAVVLVDRQRARLFRFELGELDEQTEVFDAVPRRRDHGGRSAMNIQRHTDELAHKHLKHAAEVTFEEVQGRRVDHLILGGPQELVSEFEALLHPYLRERVAARLCVMVTASPEEVRQAALGVECEVERRQEARLVSRLRDGVGSGSGGVAGLETTLRALVERRVDMLLVSDGFEAPGWRCPSCRFIAVMGRGCPVCGASMELVDDVVEHAVEEALTNKTRVHIVRENADLDVLGRIGALLRF